MPVHYPFSAVLGCETDLPEQMADMGLALVLTTISPEIGGVLVRGEKGTAKSTAVRALAAVLPPIEVYAEDRFSSDPADPSAVVESRESVRLAFVAALQHLSPRQRAVLLLREVLQWHSAEVATAIGTSTMAVNSLLQRARSQLQTVGPSSTDRLATPNSPEAQDLLARYIAAFESYDIDRLVELFTAEAIWEMPPYDAWYQGPWAIVTLIHQQCPAESAGDMRMVPLIANGQPAAAMYMRVGAAHVAFQLHVLDIRSDGVSHVVAFLDDTLFAKFGLPSSL